MKNAGVLTCSISRLLHEKFICMASIAYVQVANISRFNLLCMELNIYKIHICALGPIRSGRRGPFSEILDASLLAKSERYFLAKTIICVLFRG